jgi:hypothetical protein
MNCRTMRIGLVAVAVIIGATHLTRADIIEDFNSPSGTDGRVLFDTIASYDGIDDTEAVGLTGGDNDGNTLQNGKVTQTDGFAGGISQAQGGTGFFLLENTGGVGGGATTPAGEFWGTITPVAVLPSTLYTFSFYLTNQNTTANAQIQPFINGTSLGGPVSAAGTFASDGWQPFTFAWNSGGATTADLSLRNLQTAAVGNDFGLDTIALTAPAAVAPEPSTLASAGIAGLIGLGAVWHRRKRSAA